MPSFKEPSSRVSNAPRAACLRPGHLAWDRISHGDQGDAGHDRDVVRATLCGPAHCPRLRVQGVCGSRWHLDDVLFHDPSTHVRCPGVGGCWEATCRRCAYAAGPVVTDAQAATRAAHLSVVAAGRRARRRSGASRSGRGSVTALPGQTRRCARDRRSHEPSGVHLWPATTGEVGHVGEVRTRPRLVTRADVVTITGDPRPAASKERR